MSSEPSPDGRGLMDGDGDGDGRGEILGRGRVVVRPDGSSAAEISRAIVQLMAAVRLLLSDIAPEAGVAIQLFLFEPDADGR